jgi:antitoxin YefM
MAAEAQALGMLSRPGQRGANPVSSGPLSSLVQAGIPAYALSMQILPVSKVKDKLNELVDSVSRTREQITVTRNGSPAAVLVGIEEWESLQETLFWLSQPGILESIAEAKADVKAGRTYSEDQIRAEFNVPRR